MKKVIIGFLRCMVKVLPLYLFTLLPLNASAQVGEYRTDFAIGFNGGYSLSSIAFVPKVPQGQLGGVTAGFSARYTCEKYFKSICALVGEVNINQMGWEEDILDRNGIQTEDIPAGPFIGGAGMGDAGQTSDSQPFSNYYFYIMKTKN